MVHDDLVGSSRAAEFEFDNLRAAAAVFDADDEGYLTATQLMSILTRDCGDVSRSALAQKDAWRIINLCAERDAASGRVKVNCEALCKMLSNTR